MRAPHERWLAWQEAHTLVLQVYRATRTWPQDERFGLISQVRRAAVSIPTNLAEGSARHGPKELRRFADIALGSLAELDCLLRIARDLEYTSVEEFEALDAQRDRAGKLLFGLSRSMTRKLSSSVPPG